MPREERNTSGFAVGVLTGALLGAGVALLFAPKSGPALRQELAELMTDVRGAVVQQYRDLVNRSGIELDKLKERADRVAK